MIISVRIIPLTGGPPPETARVALRAADTVFATRTQLQAVRGLIPRSAVVEVLGDTAYDDPGGIRWDLPEEAGHVVVLTPRGWPSWHVAVALAEVAGRDRVEIAETTAPPVRAPDDAAPPARAPDHTALLEAPLNETVPLEAQQRGSPPDEASQPPGPAAAPDQARDAVPGDEPAGTAVTIDVVGLDCASGGLARDRLTGAARAALARASLVAGGARHLAEAGPLLPGGAERVEVTGDLSALDEVAKHDGPAVLLASGDPGFFGILRALRERLGPERLAEGFAVHPAVSSVAGAFAAAGLPWDDALVVSAHGRDPTAAINACRRHPKVAVLTQPGFGARELAAALGDRREYLVAHGLGTPEASVERFAPGAAPDAGTKDPNVVLVLDPEAPPSPRGLLWPARRTPESWALPEDAFEHRERMITKAEVRALVLARLGPGVGDLVWDIGAGSGSVAVECARLGAAVIAVERDPEQCGRIRGNAVRHTAPVEVVEGDALDVLDGLPVPDAVFVGGGGPDLPAILTAAAGRGPRVVVTALATLERLTPARQALEGAGYRVEAILLQASRLAPLGDGSRLAATNPVVILHARRP